MPQNPYEAPPRRRWFRFSLRTLFVLIVVASIPLARAAYSLSWIRQRAIVLQQRETVFIADWGEDYPPAPSGLWGFEVQGISKLSRLRGASPVIAEVRRLFPEAEVTEYDDP